MSVVLEKVRRIGPLLSRIAARRLQVQTDYVKQLAECDTPLGLLTCSSEFLQRSALMWTKDFEDAFEALRRSYSPPTNNP